MDAGPVPRFGLSKSIPILVAHLLLNIKKKKNRKSKKRKENLCKIKITLCF
jgi:hypothetical protein